MDDNLHCMYCAYSFRGLATDRCPECGNEIDRRALAELHKGSLLGVGAGMMMIATGCGVLGGFMSSRAAQVLYMLIEAFYPTEVDVVASETRYWLTKLGFAVPSLGFTAFVTWKILKDARTELAQIRRTRGRMPLRTFEFTVAGAATVVMLVGFAVGAIS